MIRLYLSRDKQKLAVKISGPNFNVIKDILKEHWFKFEPEFEYNDMVWLKDVDESKDALEELLKIETFDISAEIYSLLSPKPETEKFRIKYNSGILGGSPIGSYQEETIKRGIKQIGRASCRERV